MAQTKTSSYTAFNNDKVLLVRQQKQAARGGFEKGIFLIDVCEGHFPTGS